MSLSQVGARHKQCHVLLNYQWQNITKYVYSCIARVKKINILEHTFICFIPLGLMRKIILLLELLNVS